MSRIAYVNGAYVPLAGAGVSVLDRGFQFADSIYEVWAIRGGRLFDADAHMSRLRRSLNELRIHFPMSDAALYAVLRDTQRRNRVTDGIVYLQISRGAAPRDHVFPSLSVRPTIVVTAKNLDQSAIARRAAQGIKVITLPDTRWARCDIKSVNLLPNVLARQTAKEKGAFEAWFVDEAGFVTEGTSSNAFIVDAQNRIRTAAISNHILHGVTRAALLAIARDHQLKVVEEPFTTEEAKVAGEAFISAASNPAVPVVAIDAAQVGNGQPGPIAKALRAFYLGAEPENRRFEAESGLAPERRTLMFAAQPRARRGATKEA
ncbi:MAG: D-amino-acid transaminase [Proteobacteria bacterium]|nr:D-amino-acid transaminase [Pseudomonadota bacterium]